MTPTVGRTVHYYPPEGELYIPGPRAAIITDAILLDNNSNHAGDEVSWSVSLAVLRPLKLGMEQLRRRVGAKGGASLVLELDAVPFAAEPTPGHWSWSPIVAAPSSRRAPPELDAYQETYDDFISRDYSGGDLHSLRNDVADLVRALERAIATVRK